MSSSPRDDEQKAGARVMVEVSTAPSSGNAVETRQGASVLLFRGDAVLLVRRGAAGAAAGLWSAPGGHVEPGETAEQAARRELTEETGLDSGRLIEVCVHEIAAGMAAMPSYRITVFAGLAPANPLPVAASDAEDVRLVPLDQFAALATTDGLGVVVAKAARMLGVAPPDGT